MLHCWKCCLSDELHQRTICSLGWRWVIQGMNRENSVSGTLFVSIRITKYRLSGCRLWKRAVHKLTAKFCVLRKFLISKIWDDTQLIPLDLCSWFLSSPYSLHTMCNTLFWCYSVMLKVPSLYRNSEVKLVQPTNNQPGEGTRQVGQYLLGWV